MAEPVFQHGSFRLYLLQSLADGPRHGYDIMASLGERFGGSYRPSPGTVYPRLSKLVDEGMLTMRRDGRKRVYLLTDAGRRELAERADELRELNDEMNDSVQRLAMDVRARVTESLDAMRADLAAQRDGGPQTRPEQAEAREASGASSASDAAASQRERRAEIVLLASQFAARMRAESGLAAAHNTLTAEQVAELRRMLESFRLD